MCEETLAMRAAILGLLYHLYSLNEELGAQNLELRLLYPYMCPFIPLFSQNHNFQATLGIILHLITDPVDLLAPFLMHRLISPLVEWVLQV